MLNGYLFSRSDAVIFANFGVFIDAAEKNYQKMFGITAQYLKMQFKDQISAC